MEGPLLPEGPGGEEPPEWPGDGSAESEQAFGVYQERLDAFERLFVYPRGKRRRRMSDYTCKNCEEAWGYPGG